MHRRVSFPPRHDAVTWYQVLLEESTQRVPAALHGLAVFVDTLRLLVDAQQTVAAMSVSPPHAPSEDSPAETDSAAPMDEDTQAVSQAQRLEASAVLIKKEAGQDASRDAAKGAAGQ